VASYHQTLPENHPHQKINLGYGIYTGKAIVGNVDYAHRQEYTVIGDAVNMATQMASLASPGQVLVNGTAYEKTGQKIFAEPVVPDSSPERTSSLMFYEAQQTRG
jgi:class 3 adenylate cyclase